MKTLQTIHECWSEKLNVHVSMVVATLSGVMRLEAEVGVG